MKYKTKKRIAAVLIALILAMLTVLMTISVSAEAKGVTGRAKDPAGNLYIIKDGEIQTGHFRYHGKWYYAHATNSGSPLGSLTTDAFRVDPLNRWTYYQKNGAALRKSTHYIKLKSNGYVRYIYVPGTGRKQRYNTKLHRYQIKKKGKWYEVGMQCLPYGQLDEQL